MSGLFESIGSSVGGVISGGASGVVQGLPGAVSGGVQGGIAGAAGGAAAGAAVGAVGGLGVGDVVTIPAGAGAGAIGGGLVGSATGAGAGFAPGFNQGFNENYGSGAAIGGGYGQALDETRLGKKLNAMIKGHEEARKAAGGDQTLCNGQCLANEASDGDIKKLSDKELEKAAKANGFKDAHDLKDEYGFGSETDIGADKNGNLYSGPRLKGQGGFQPLGINKGGS